jgi:hypothetical protein
VIEEISLNRGIVNVPEFGEFFTVRFGKSSFTAYLKEKKNVGSGLMLRQLSWFWRRT